MTGICAEELLHLLPGPCQMELICSMETQLRSLPVRWHWCCQTPGKGPQLQIHSLHIRSRCLSSGWTPATSMERRVPCRWCRRTGGKPACAPGGRPSGVEGHSGSSSPSKLSTSGFSERSPQPAGSRQAWLGKQNRSRSFSRPDTDIWTWKRRRAAARRESKQQLKNSSMSHFSAEKTRCCWKLGPSSGSSSTDQLGALSDH